MNNKEISARLDEDELRGFYLDSKGMDKIISVFYMIISGLISIGFICYAIIEKVYWILSFSVVSIIVFIVSISKFSKIIENIFENRIYEDEREEEKEDA